MKVMTVVGTRPELIRLSRTIAELDRSADHVLTHTGQNHDYELNHVFFEDLKIRKPDHFLEVFAGSLGERIGKIIARTDAVLKKESPQALLVLGDTNSCLSVIPAKRRKIPIFHIEAGNRCFDLNVPEEINRKIVDHVSDVNLTYSEHARRNLLAEGLNPQLTIKLGSPMDEVLTYYRPGIESSDILNRLGLKPSEFFLISLHREENVDDPEQLSLFFQTLELLSETYGSPIVISTHPRTQNNIEKFKLQSDNPLHRFIKPLGYFDYVKLQRSARCVLSDSGTITEEASLLKFPAVTLRHTHERPEGMDEATVLMCGLKPENVMNAVKIAIRHAQEGLESLGVVGDYRSAAYSKKVARIILSYAPYVDRYTWRKHE